MKILPMTLALAGLALVPDSVAQNLPSPLAAPSSVSDTSRLAQPLAGTLFFDQKQRDRMDRSRRRGEVPADGTTAEPAPSVLNGFVKRSDGQSAIWIDGEARFNIQSESVRQLRPTDVGGSAESIKVISSSAFVTPTGKAPLAVKISPRKPARKRPAASR